MTTTYSIKWRKTKSIFNMIIFVMFFCSFNINPNNESLLWRLNSCVNCYFMFFFYYIEEFQLFNRVIRSYSLENFQCTDIRFSTNLAIMLLTTYAQGRSSSPGYRRNAGRPSLSVDVFVFYLYAITVFATQTYKYTIGPNQYLLINNN